MKNIKILFLSLSVAVVLVFSSSVLAQTEDDDEELSLPDCGEECGGDGDELSPEEAEKLWEAELKKEAAEAVAKTPTEAVAAEKTAEESAAKKATDEKVTKTETVTEQKIKAVVPGEQKPVVVPKTTVQEPSRAPAPLTAPAKEEASFKLEQERAEQTKREQERQTEFARLIQENAAFREINQITPIETPPPYASLSAVLNDRNNNGIPDNLELAAEGTTNVQNIDPDVVRFETERTVKINTLVQQENKSVKEATEIAEKEFTSKKTKKRRTVIRQASAKAYQHTIQSALDDANGDGVSDEVAVYFSLNPTETVSESAQILPLEKQLYRIDERKLEVKCSASLRSGDKLSAKGFTVLAACPKNKTFSLIATDTKGKKYTLDTQTAAHNNKLAFAIDKKFRTGTYIFQLRETKPRQTGAAPFLWLASVIAEEPAETGITSDPVIAEVVPETDVQEPVVRNIQDVDVTGGMNNIKISAASDGKIRVTGTSDISTLVLGTFQSAVFTSAILADVETGSFQLTSPRPLESGDHEVVVYATNPENNEQSPPVKFNFSIVETAKAANQTLAPQTRVLYRTSPMENGFPVKAAAGAGAAVVLLAFAITYWKRRGKTP